jgi:hypothetical protein
MKHFDHLHLNELYEQRLSLFDQLQQKIYYRGQKMPNKEFDYWKDF